MKKVLFHLFASNSIGDEEPHLEDTKLFKQKRHSANKSPKLLESNISEKLKRCNKQACLVDQEELLAWSHMLSSNDELREYYFHPDFERIYNLEGLQNGGHAPKDLDDLDSKLYDLADIRNQHSSSYFQIGKHIRIRFILSEAAAIGATEHMSIRKILNPLKVTLMQREEPAVLSCALVVGPWFLEWDPNTSLCIPRRLASDAAILAASSWQIKYIDLDFVLDKIIPVIIDWNKNKVYDSENANAQHFVDALIKALEIEENLDSSKSMVGDYLNILRTKGYCHMSTVICEELKTKCNLTDSVYSFKTHEQVDNAFYAILDKEPMFPEDFPIEGYLFLMMDRVFWQRHFHSPDDPRFKATEHKTGCPFQDPRLAVTIRRKYFS